MAYSPICPECGWEYPFGSETTYYTYEREPVYNHILTSCPSCLASHTIWDPTPAQVKALSADVCRSTAAVATTLHRNRYATHCIGSSFDERKQQSLLLTEMAKSIAHIAGKKDEQK